VEQLPWTIPNKVQELVDSLRSMQLIDLAETPIMLNKGLWPTLAKNVNNVITDKYNSLQTDLFAEQRRGRSADDMGDTNYLKTVENRLSSLCKNLADKIEERALKSEDGTFPEIFVEMKECFNLQYLYETRNPEFGVKAALDRHFGGRHKWHFVTKQNKKDSLVTSRLKMEMPKLPFY
jgi:hypothetical protein